MTRILLLASAVIFAVPAFAQTPPLQEEGGSPPPTEIDPMAGVDEEDIEEITVVARRDPTAVIGDIPPENTLSARDIRAYGAASVAELIEALSPQLGSARGRGGGGQPVVLLNGRRISGFREVRDLPPEAILRMDILPEEVALKYGFRADQRVLNIVLRPRFRSTSVRGEGELPTDGGSFEHELDLTRLLIGDNGRTTINARAEGNSALTESERDIRFDGEGTDPRRFRTLVGEQELLRVGATHNRPLGDVSATIDGQVERTRGDSLLGPALLTPGDALGRDRDTLSGRLGVALNGNVDRWRWSLTGAYEAARSETETDRESDALDSFTDRTRTVSQTGNLELVANGSLFRLPAGDSGVTLRLGADTRRLDSRARRAGIETNDEPLDRQRGTAAVNLDLPISRRRSDFDNLGNLTLNANAEVERLSDFGTLATIGAGLSWSPVERLQLLASWTREEGSPSLNQLGDPFVITPDSRIFDFTTGETVLVEAVTGGNSALDADTRRVLKLGGNWRPWEETDLTLRADYVRTRIDDPISGFPGVTEAIEDAFGDRFTRVDGQLVRVDLRPVNFDRSERQELRWGFNFSKPLASQRPPQSVIDEFRRRFGVAPGGAGRPGGQGGQAGQGAGATSGPPPGARRQGGGGGGRGGGGPFGGGGQGGRLQLSVTHNWIFTDEIRIAPGLPTLDFLSGDVIEGGFRPRHRIEAEGGWFNNGLGARLSANWQSGGDVGSGDDRLDFSPLARVNLNLFANLGERWELALKHPWLRGTQVRFRVENIFDSKQKVRDAANGVPLNYQRDLLDPQGRTISLSIRKLFLPPPRFFRRPQPAAGS